MFYFRENKLLLLFLFAALGLRLLIACSPLEWLTKQNIIGDDSFYYFTIARNIAEGNGITFDRLSPTNGFHPLWMVLIIPVFFFINDDFLAINSILIVGAIINIFSIYLLYYILKEFKISQRVIFIITVFFAFSPTVLFSMAGPMNGLETSLNIFMIFVYILLYLRLNNKINCTKPVPMKSFVLFGVVSGLLFLTRTDNAIILVVTWIMLLINSRKLIKAKTKTGFLMSILISCIVVAPWLIWSYLTFGELVQVSGKSVAFMIHEYLAGQGWTIIDYCIQFLKNLGSSFIYISGILVESKFSFEFLVVAVSFLICLFLLMIDFFKNNLQNLQPEKQLLISRLQSLSPFIVASLTFVSVHTFRTVYFRPWYYFSIVPVFIVLAAILLEYAFFSIKVCERHKNPKFLIVGTAVILTLIFVYSSATIKKFVSGRENSGDLMKYQTIQIMNEILPENSRVGSWNAGIFGYFFKKGQVINLDGLVNNEAYPYILSHSLAQYAEQNRITYLVDHQDALKSWAPYWRSGLSNISDVLDVLYLTEDRHEKNYIVVGLLRY